MAIKDWQTALMDKRFWVWYYINFWEIEDEEVTEDEDITEGEETTEDEEEYESPVERGARIFSVTVDSIDEFYEELKGYDYDVAPLNVLDVPFPENYIWRIEFWPESIEHNLIHPDFPDPLFLGSDNGHCVLPTLRLDDVLAVTACLQRNWTADYSPHVILPLCAVLVGGTDERGRKRQVFRDAWRTLGLLDDAHLEMMLDNISIGIDPFHWTHDPTLGWITDAPNSLRNPKNIDKKRVYWTREEFDRFNHFLDWVNRCAGG